MIVVSNTSPIINLAVIDHLNLLHQLYSEVIIPRAVYNEIVIAGEGQPGAVDIKGARWIAVKDVTNQALVTALRLDLDDGEAEAITQAVELKADLLLIDERKGRRLAEALGCRVIGLLAVLVEAKQQELLPAVKPILDQLILEAGFRVSSALYERVLEVVAEPKDRR
jgi:predicted nucleic acid-binding protein